MTSIICWGVVTRSMPAARHAASIERAPLTIAPVCERARARRGLTRPDG